jgi:hypothetical protein
MSLSVSAVGGYDTLFPIYNASPVSPVRQAGKVTRGTEGMTDTNETNKVQKSECQTCKNRKYVDGSNEGDVSFKTPGHISPESSASTVMAHEQEHVSNARAEGSKENKELVSATVTLKTSVCPECGRVYVSGGTTHTKIQTTVSSSANPYDKLQQDMNRNLLSGMNFDMSA